MALAVVLVLLLSVGGAAGQSAAPQEGNQPQGEISITAAVNSRISYQGVLKENGNPVTGSRDMTFRLYADVACTTQVGSDIVKSGVQVTEGLFSVGLDVTHDDLNGQGLWLQVEVSGNAIGCREIMPVPYALSLRPGADIIGWQSGSSILTVENSSPANDSRAMRGYASATTGFTAGVNGRTDSSSTGAKGVWGYAAAASGQTYGVHGESNSTSGRGVYGRANASSGSAYGVYGESNSTSGRGVYGIATATSGPTYGVYARTYSSTDWSTSVYGFADADSGITIGVRGISNSTTGRGVAGSATADSGYNIGVYGRSDSPDGYGGYFSGNVHVDGTLSKNGGSFKIDHPLDPENQYLSHSFVESPDMMNVYNGNVVLDGSGEAWVELPDYFEALNRDFRYQLTPIGAPGPNLYIATEVSGNRFQIAGGQPGSRVSWQVTGIRQDPWANAHRIPVEEEKPAEERGYYMCPEVYGQPETRGIEWLRDPGGSQ
jgi:hypothetical protein